MDGIQCFNVAIPPLLWMGRGYMSYLSFTVIITNKLTISLKNISSDRAGEESKAIAAGQHKHDIRLFNYKFESI